MGRSQVNNKSAPTSKATTSTSLNLESYPVSLLWAHQLRREHVALLSRIETLTDSVGTVRPQVEKMVTSMKKAHDGVATLRSDNEKAWKEVERLQGYAEVANHHVDICEAVREDIEGLASRVDGIERLTEEVRGEVQAAVEDYPNKDYLALLNERVDFVEVRIDKLSRMQKENEEVVLVKDSMQGLGRLMNKKWNNTSHGIYRPFSQRQIDQNGSPLLGYASNQLDNLEFSNAEEDVTRKLTLNHRKTARDPTSASTSIAGDIDLDEHVPTISYAGHNPYRTRNNPPPDSLIMLPELDAIKTLPRMPIRQLEQDHHQTWESYLEEGQAVFDAAPKRKEGEVVEAFVSGVHDPDRKRDCEKWLDERIWTWENVKRFQEQLNSAETQTQAAIHAPREVPREVQLNNAETRKKRFARSAIIAQPAEPAMKVAKEQARKLNTLAQGSLNEPRRSHRLMEKHEENQPVDKKQIQARLRVQSRAAQIQAKESQFPMSYQPLSKQQQLMKKLNLPVPKSLFEEIEPAMEYATQNVFPTASDQILQQTFDEPEPYTLPPMPKKINPKKPKLPPPGVKILSSKPEEQPERGRKRKRDYKGHFVRADQSENAILDGSTNGVGGFRDVVDERMDTVSTHATIKTSSVVRNGSRRKEVEADEMRVLKRTIHRQQVTPVAMLEGEEVKSKTTIHEAKRLPLKPKLNVSALTEKGLCRGEVDGRQTIDYIAPDRVNAGLVAKSIELDDENLEHADRSSPPPKIIVTSQMKTVTGKKKPVVKQHQKTYGKKNVRGCGGATRLPPEIPILPSTSSNDE